MVTSMTMTESGLDLRLVGKALEKLPRNLSKNLANYAKREMKRRAPVFTGKLKNAIISKPIKQTKKVSVWSAGVFEPQQQLVAMANEWGVKPHRVSLNDNPQMQQWASQVLGIPLISGKIKVGYPGTTALGTKNKFIEPAFNDTMIRADSIIDKALKKHLRIVS